MSRKDIKLRRADNRNRLREAQRQAQLGMVLRKVSEQILYDMEKHPDFAGSRNISEADFDKLLQLSSWGNEKLN